MAGTWQSMYEGIASERLLRFIEFEGAASSTRHFQPLLVPGLLQTEEYARVILGQLNGHLSGDRVDALVEVRMRRQELLNRQDPPELFFILDEAAARRLIGDRAVMRRQLRRLTELAEKPRITIEVLPFSAGAYPALSGSFVVHELPDPGGAGALYLEGAHGEELTSDDPQLILRHREIFEELRRLSLGPEGSLAFLSELVDGLALPAAAGTEAARRSTPSFGLIENSNGGRP